MSQSYEQLVAAFKELMERGEKDQWKLAQIAYIASGTGYGGITSFAKDVGRAVDTVRRYVAAFEYRESNEDMVPDHTFNDIVMLSNMSEERANALRILAGATGNTLRGVKEDTDRINVVKNFLVDNPELVKDALKDDGARAAVATAAFKAATEDVVVEATGITKEAAKAKAPVKNSSTRSVQVEQLKYKASRVGHWAEGNLPSIVRETQALAEYMTADELDFVFDQLGNAHDLISEARNVINELRKAKV